MIRYIISKMMGAEGLLMLLPMMVGIIYGEHTSVYFLITAAILTAIYLLFGRKCPEIMTIYAKEGLIIVATAWIFWSLAGALPFVLSKSIPSYVDAFFETVSGFTTTGSTILTEIEGLPKGILFWRSLTHWVGGMGVLVFVMVLTSLDEKNSMHLMRAEVPGPEKDKLVPKTKTTARILYGIYFGLTLILVILLMFGGMNLFEALTTSFGTAGTGGFAIWNDGFVSVSPYNQWVVTIFMLLFGVNFGFYFLILTGKLRDALKFEEVRIYFIIVIAAAVFIFINLRHFALYAPAEGIRQAFFQVASIITTTGFASADFNLWPETSRTILVLLMFIGACAGSTGGGIKVSRFIIACKSFIKEIISYLHPRSVKKIKIEGKPLEHETLRATNVYFMTYMVIFAVSVLLVSIENKDLVTNFAAVAATFNNIGPGLSLVGPMANFGHFTDFTKYILMFDMLAGRLEIFPMMLLFCPAVWKRRRD